MNVESAPGRGSRFTLVTPAPVPEALPAEPTAAAPPPAAGALATVDHPGRGTSPRIRVLLADDHVVMREGLSRLLGEQPDIEIVGEAGDGEAAIELARQLHPDVVVMDVSMPRTNGLDATRQLVLEQPGLHVIGLSMHDGAAMGRAMRQAGAVGYIAKSGPPADVLAAIRACAARAAPVENRGRKPGHRPSAASSGNRRRSAARRRTAGSRKRTTRSK